MARGDTVLVVDDDPGILEIVKLILESSGYDVITAADGAEALRCLRDAHDHVKLILLDMMMPNVDGWQFRESQRDSHLDGTPSRSGHPSFSASRWSSTSCSRR